FLIIIFIFFKDKKSLSYLMLNLIICGILVIILKNIIKKKRPDEKYSSKRLFGNHYSMPSGHLASNLSLFFSLIVINLKLSYLFLAFSIIITFYKLYNHEHDLYDLLVAILVGIFSSLFSYFLFDKFSFLVFKIFNI
ncbi:MAG: phosphatase PAP2 family protein, partial [Exilispira sp.]